MVKKIYDKDLQLKVENQLVESAVPISTKTKISLYKKSKNSGIPVNVLEEVYIRGYNIWNEEFKGTREQFAFDRVNSFVAGGFAADIDNDLLSEESLRDWFSKSKSKDGKPGWVQIGGRYEGKPCARQPGQTTTPKCRPSREASKMSKKEKTYAFRKKQKEDPNQPSKSGAAKPNYVSTYKEEIELEEKKDACYHKVKSRYKVWPSAYACVPENTSKALTRDGWKSVDMLNIGDEIMTFNIQKDILEFKPIIQIHRYENVPTVIAQCGNTGYIFETTSNHKWVVKMQDDKCALLTTEEIIKAPLNKKIIISACYEGGSSLKKDKIFKYGDNWIKYILEISEEQRQSWLFSSIVYDGNQIKTQRILEKTNTISDLDYMYSGNHGKQTFGFKQKDIMHRDAFLLSAFLNGGSVTWKKHNSKNIYSCNYISNKRFKNTSNIKKISNNMNNVWCPETENNTWVMMQETNNKGIITITGNSGALVKCRKKGAANWGSKTVKEEVLNKKVMTPKEISKKYDVPLNYVKSQLQAGIKIEKEHTSDSITAKRIALAHLSERPDYYVKLKKVGLEEKVNYEKPTKDPNKSSSRFEGTDELVLNYKTKTPGQNIKEEDMSTDETLFRKIKRILDEAKSPAWQRKEGKDPEGGLNKKGVASYRAQNPGSKLQTAVTTPPSKLKKGSKSWKRRKSFCARMSGVRGPMKKNGKPTRKALALRKWNC